MTAAVPSRIRYPRRILCATDFSDCSRRALEHAIAVARPVGGEITLLHVLLLPLPSVESDDEPDWMPLGPAPRREIIDRMRRFAQPVEVAGLTVRLELCEGLPGDQIVRAARAMETDLIVMGSHGRRGLERLLGSHAERVLRTAPCPVLVVGRSMGATAKAPEGIREILCAVSGSEHSPRTLDYAQCFATRTGAHLTLLHVTEPGLLRVPPVPPWSGRIQASRRIEERVSCGSPRAEILRCAKERGVDLIVMGAHDRGPGVLGYLGSTCGQVAPAAGCAVVVVRATPSPAETRRLSGDAAPVEVGAGRAR